MRRISGTSLLVAALLALGVVGGMLSAPTSAEPVTRTPAPARATTKAVHEIRVFGRSVKGRALRAYRVGDPTSPVKAVVIATMHGDERGPARILLDLINGAPITGADIWLIPYLNRDGMARHTRQNARGVDLNRNYPVHWTRQRGHYNSGRKPASEPETRALMRFLTAVKPRYVISFHQPLHGVDTSYGKARPLALRLVDGLGLPPSVFNCHGGCHGTMTEWFNKKFAGSALTVEYGARLSWQQANVSGPSGVLSAVFASR